VRMLVGTEVTHVRGTRIVSSYVTSVEHGQGTWCSTSIPVVLYTILYYHQLSSPRSDTWTVTRGPQVLTVLRPAERHHQRDRHYLNQATLRGRCCLGARPRRQLADT